MTSNYVNSESYSEEEWLNMLFLKSESENSRKAGKTAMNLFDLFCKDQEMTRDEMVQKYCNYLGKDKPDVKSVCMSLNKFIAFLLTFIIREHFMYELMNLKTNMS